MTLTTIENVAPYISHFSLATISIEAVDMAEKNLPDILAMAIEHRASQSVVVVFDARCDLAVALTEDYRRCPPVATFVDFDAASPEVVLSAFAALGAADLVILIQSTNFRLEALRLRVELFKRGLIARSPAWSIVVVAAHFFVLF